MNSNDGIMTEQKDYNKLGRISRTCKKFPFSGSNSRKNQLSRKKPSDLEVFVQSSTTDAEGKQTAITNYDSSLSCKRFPGSFYDVPCEQLAKNLLGHILVRQLNSGKLLRGKIVETECYPGGDDKGSNSFQGRITKGNAPTYMKPGTTYVYFTYGMYHCFNISSQGPGAAVLLRAIEPLEGMDYMQLERNKKRKVACTLKPHQLANGPSKLCMSMSIDKASCNTQDLCSWSGLWIEEVAKDWICGDSQWQAAVEPHRVVSTSRIGISSVGHEWASKPYRFYVLGNASVSRIDKVKEEEISSLVEVSERKRPRWSSSSHSQ